MNKQNKFILYTVLGVVLAHLIFSISLSLLTSSLYDNRMINVRHVDFDRHLHASLIAPFVFDNVKSDERPDLMIAGSSFSWGYSFPKSETLSFHLQSKLSDQKVTNMSVIGDSPIGTLGNLCLVKKLGVSVDTLIVEINIANFAKRKRILTYAPPRCSDYGEWDYIDKVLPYSFFFLSSPFGLKHFSIIHDEFDYPRPYDRKFRFKTVRDGYFNTPAEAASTYEAKKSVLVQLLETSKDVAGRVVFYIAPINAHGVSLSQYKMDDISAQIESLLSVCKEVANIECLDVRLDLDESLFMNLTHLNMVGHKYFAGYLADIINGNTPSSFGENAPNQSDQALVSDNVIESLDSSSPIDCDMLSGKSINIGAAPATYFSSVSVYRLATVSSGVHQLSLSVDDVSEAGVGRYVEIRNTEGSGDHASIRGCHKIIAIRENLSQIVLEVRNKRDSMPKSIVLASASVEQLSTTLRIK